MRTAALFLSLAIAGCAAQTGSMALVEPDCLTRFHTYDRAVQIFGYSQRDRFGSPDLMAPPAVDRAGQRLRENGCLTTDQDLAAAYLLGEDVRTTRIVESGAPIDPISLHAGIVSGIVSEVQARQFFGALGVRVRSQGAPGLGRRIYLGPFATQGGLDEATELARRAGFAAPYPARF